MKEEKQKIIVLIVLVLIAIVVAVISLFVNKKNDNKVLEKSLEEIGKRFYSEYLYEKQRDAINLAVKNDRKMTFSLNNLSLLIDEKYVEQLDNSKLSNCNWQKTTIVFTPKYPIEKDNFDIEVNLSC